MTKYITKKRIEEMANTIIDEETRMTELDYAEWSDPYQDWVVVDDQVVRVED